MRLKGKVALVTVASRGIGFAVAGLFALADRLWLPDQQFLRQQLPGCTIVPLYGGHNI